MAVLWNSSKIMYWTCLWKMSSSYTYFRFSRMTDRAEFREELLVVVFHHFLYSNYYLKNAQSLFQFMLKFLSDQLECTMQ